MGDTRLEGGRKGGRNLGEFRRTGTTGAGKWKICRPRKPVPSTEMGRELALHQAFGGATGPSGAGIRSILGTKAGLRECTRLPGRA